MFTFEQPVTVRDYESAMFQKRSSRVVYQNGIQPVAFVEQDVRDYQRPQPLLNSFFSFHRRKG